MCLLAVPLVWMGTGKNEPCSTPGNPDCVNNDALWAGRMLWIGLVFLAAAVVAGGLGAWLRAAAIRKARPID
jgi:hypothetical protein